MSATCHDCRELFDPDTMHLIKAHTLSGRALICDPCHVAEVTRNIEFNLMLKARREKERAEYTPDTEHVREQYTREQPPHVGTVSEKGREFDRWLRQVKAEVLREAAEDLSFTVHDILGYKFPAVVTEELLDRADKIEKGEA